MVSLVVSYTGLLSRTSWAISVLPGLQLKLQPSPTGPLSRNSSAARDQCSAWTTTKVTAQSNRTAVQKQLGCQGPVFSLDYN
ncbi:unnamed protein product [Lota lota]